MSKVIRVSDELYALLEETAFKNGVGIQHLADKVIEIGIERAKEAPLAVKERGREVEIHW